MRRPLLAALALIVSCSRVPRLGPCRPGALGCACNTYGACDEGVCQDGVCANSSCPAGRPGCACLGSGGCERGAMCLRGLCFDDAVRPPASYYYTLRASEDVGAVHALILARAGFEPGMRVADVGAGRGLLTMPIARRVGPSGQVFATDIATDALAALRAAVRASPAAERANVDVRQVRGPRDTALDDVAAGSLHRVLMINVFGFSEASRDDGSVPFLRRIAALLRPDGRLIYHQDWLNAPHELDRDAVTALFESAGLRRVDEIPMPAHMPPQTEYYAQGLSAPPRVLKRGYILVFGPASPTR